PPGGTLDVKIKFTGTGQSIFNGTLIINNDDSDEPVTKVQLVGWWQAYSEQTPSHQYVEPTLQNVVQVFGYGTTISFPGQSLDEHGLIDKVGEETLSGYWLRAD